MRARRDAKAGDRTQPRESQMDRVRQPGRKRSRWVSRTATVPSTEPLNSVARTIGRTCDARAEFLLFSGVGRQTRAGSVRVRQVQGPGVIRRPSVATARAPRQAALLDANGKWGGDTLNVRAADHRWGQPTAGPVPVRPRLAVIIAANNEEAVLARCLDALLADAHPGELEIIVAANGCRDRTVEIAAGYGEPVRVEITETASKHAALNAGDAAATVFPRAYVDADITVSASALHAVAGALQQANALVGAPRAVFDFTGCAFLVRSFYRVWLELPWSTDNAVGSGVYLLTEEGHRRLGSFPAVANDDEFVHDLFAAAERVCLRSHRFTVRPARTAAALIRRRARTLHGSRMLAAQFGPLVGACAQRSLGELVRRRPALLLDIPAFRLISTLASRAATRKSATGDTGWERDETSREPKTPAGQRFRRSAGELRTSVGPIVRRGRRTGVGGQPVVGAAAADPVGSELRSGTVLPLP